MKKVYGWTITYYIKGGGGGFESRSSDDLYTSRLSAAVALEVVLNEMKGSDRYNYRIEHTTINPYNVK